MRPRPSIQTFGIAAALAFLIGCTGRTPVAAGKQHEPGVAKRQEIVDRDVLAWLKEAPFDNPDAVGAKSDFSYDQWFARGRALPGAIDTLIELLEQEDLQHPSGLGMRAAYALGWIGDRRRRGVEALLRSLNSSDPALRMEAASGLGRQGDASVLPVLEKLLGNPEEDVNVRANACIAIGRLGAPSSLPLLRQTLQDPNPFLAACAREALRLHGER